jgi:hypothetical protein
VYADVMHFEDMQGAFYSGGISISDNSELHLRGSYLKTAAGPAVIHNGGTARIQGMTVDTSSANKPGNHAVKVAGPGLILDHCVLVAPPLANSVNAAAGQTVTCYAVKANRAKHANVTVNVDPITVDANVV